MILIASRLAPQRVARLSPKATCRRVALEGAKRETQRKTEDEKIAEGLEALNRAKGRLICRNDVKVIEALASEGSSHSRHDVFR
jgi:hypothetical protein